jgi:S-adenosylhomocysteine hydrolase
LERGKNKPVVHVLPKKLDKVVARLHLAKIGGKLTMLSARATG